MAPETRGRPYRDPSTTYVSGSAFKDQLTFESNLLQKITEIRSSREVDICNTIIYTDIHPSWVEDAINLLEEHKCFKGYSPHSKEFKIKFSHTHLHNAHQAWYHQVHGKWLDSGILTTEELRQLRVFSYTMDTFPDGTYAGEIIVPNFSIRLEAEEMPRVIFESGWGESLEEVRAEIRHWMTGGDGAIKAGIVVKWQEVGEDTGRVGGVIEVYTLDQNGMPRRTQTEVIFPLSEVAEPAIQAIRLPRRIFFDSWIDPTGAGHPEDILTLDLDLLRDVAESQMGIMGYSPAE